MIYHLDHLVLTTAREANCVDFYTRVLGMQLESFVGGTPPVERRAFKFGNQKINLHVRGKDLHVESEAQDMYAAIDLLMDKLDRQVLRHKDRIQDHHRSAVRGYNGATEIA